MQKTPEGRFAGYYDMVMGFIVGHTVVQAFMDAGVNAYRFIATIDDRTTDECRALHGKVFRMEELKLGINAPPVYPPPHPCRSVIQAVEVDAEGVPAARGSDVFSGSGEKVYYDPSYDYSVRIPRYNDMVNESISTACEDVAKRGTEDGCEHMRLIDADTGELAYTEDGTMDDPEAVGGDSFWDFARNNKDRRFVFVHNHNEAQPLSETDVQTLLTTPCIDTMVAVQNDGVKYIAPKNEGVKLNSFLLDPLYPEIEKELRIRSQNGMLASERSIVRWEMLFERLKQDYLGEYYEDGK